MISESYIAPYLGQRVRIQFADGAADEGLLMRNAGQFALISLGKWPNRFTLDEVAEFRPLTMPETRTPA